jgi:L-histidine N-alpha-methyltransferase
MSAFLQDVLKGLLSQNKYLDSKYFYDACGDELFRKIMNCPEYYLTGCEMEIFTGQVDKLAAAFTNNINEFDLVELGVGDGSKSIHLLQQLINDKISFTYFPVDISTNVIRQLNDELVQKLPALRFVGLNGEYFKMLAEAKALSSKIKVVLFLGSNIGNYTLTEARDFCSSLRQYLVPGDLVLIGFDLKKDPQLISNAYNDKEGYTRDFNLNLLKRINRELGGDFRIDQFHHYPCYDPATGACKSYLVSKKEQVVHLDGNDIHFSDGETIYMEVSQKFTVSQTDELAHESGFRPLHYFYDSKKWFLDAVWQCV